MVCYGLGNQKILESRYIFDIVGQLLQDKGNL